MSIEHTTFTEGNKANSSLPIEIDINPVIKM